MSRPTSPSHLPATTRFASDSQDPLQKEFLRLLREIEEFKQNMGAMDEAMLRARARYAEEIQPLVNKLIDARLELLPLLAQAYTDFSLRKGEKAKLAEVIRFIILDLAERFGQDPEPLIEDFLETLGGTPENLAMMEEAQSPCGKGFPGEDGLDGMDGEMGPDGGESNTEGTETSKGRGGKKGRAKAGADPADIQGELRALYLKLSKDLHPDREMDPEKRAAKTTWMQRVTHAYQEKDLFALLEILAQNPFTTATDSQSLGALTAKTIRRFIKQLKEQRQGLKMKMLTRMLGSGEFQFFGKFLRGGEINPKAFQKTRKELRAEMDQAKKLDITYRDPDVLREYLKMVGRYPMEAFV